MKPNAAKRTHAGVSAVVARQVGPRRVGGRYLTAYWQQEYDVLAIDVIDGFAWFTVRWDDGSCGRHATAWSRGDRVVRQP